MGFTKNFYFVPSGNRFRQNVSTWFSFTSLRQLALCVALGGVPLVAQTFYVSTSGNDSWSGQLAAPNGSYSDGPFRSIGRAQQAMQQSSTKTATLRGGTYSIGGGLYLGGGDAGETWISYPGETATLDGSGYANVQIAYTSNITLQQLTLQNMGTNSIAVNYVNALALRWNTILNCNQGCLNGPALTNSIVDSNTFNGQYSGSSNEGYSAIYLFSGSSGNQLTHNLFENLQGEGIAFATGPYDPPCSYNLIDRNRFQNIDSTDIDGGAIYIYDRSHSGVGNQITNNVIQGNTGSGYWTKAFYLDDGASNVTISGNVCSGCGQWAWQVHVGDHNVITNNIFDLSAGGSLLGLYQTNPQGQDWGMTGNVFQRNLVYFSGSAPSSLYQVNTVPSDSLPATSNNLYFSASGAPIPNGAGIVDSNPVYADPQFAQPSAGNYAMPNSSPAYTLIGFQALPTDQGPLPVPGSPAPPPTGSSGGSLSGQGNSSSNTVNLTSEGATDWAHWGTTSLTRKAYVTPLISNYSIVGSGPSIYYTNDPRAVTFTDGTSPTQATVRDGIYINGQNGLAFTAPADGTQRTLTVHVGGYYSGGTLRAHLSDGSAADFVDTTGVTYGQYDRNYTLTYHAAAGGQTLTVSWTCNSSGGNVTLNGAALH